MATRFRLNFEQIFGTSAQVLAGGTLTFAISGGAPDQLQAIYSDDALTVTKLNPVTLDSAGKHGDIFLQPKDYRVILKDAAGIQIPGGDVDPVHGGVGAGDVTFIQDGTGAVSRSGLDKLRESVSVKDFGAVGDGVADDAAAFQAAINYCQDHLKALRIPGNNPSAAYKIGATLFVTKPIVITGDGKYIVTLQGVGLAAGAYLFDVDGTAFGTFERASIGGFTLMVADAVPKLMRIKNVSESRFYDIGLRGGLWGVLYTGTRCFSNVFERLSTVATAPLDVQFLMQGHTGGGQHSFRECSFGGKTGFSISADTYTDGVALYNCNFEQCATNSVYVGGTVYGLGFYTCRTEGCLSTDFQINPAPSNVVVGLTITGCNFSSSNSGGVDRISLGGAGGGVRGFNISGNAVNHGANNFSAKLVNLNGDGESGMIAFNYLNGLKANCAPVNVRRQEVGVFNNEARDGKFAGELDVEGPQPWTPTDTSGAGLVFASSSGSYIRQGAAVRSAIALVYPGTVNGANAQLGPLPYADPDAGGADRAGVAVSFTDASGIVGGSRVGSDTHFYKAGGVRVTNADLSGKTLYIVATYTTTQP